MAHISESTASFRVIGDLLDPEEITKLLGASPTFSHRKGEVITGRTTGTKREARFGIWLINASKRVPENLDGQVEEVLSQLTDDISVWKDLGGQFVLNLFCGLFMKEGNEGLTISPKTLLMLGQRGISIDLDIYDPADENSKQEPRKE